MKTYTVELRHAASKRTLNATPDNRLDPLNRRLDGDREAADWARDTLIDFARNRGGADYQYVEAAVLELLPIGQTLDGKDYRRIGRWVCNADGLTWRTAAAPVRA